MREKLRRSVAALGAGRALPVSPKWVLRIGRAPLRRILTIIEIEVVIWCGHRVSCFGDSGFINGFPDRLVQIGPFDINGYRGPVGSAVLVTAVRTLPPLVNVIAVGSVLSPRGVANRRIWPKPGHRQGWAWVIWPRGFPCSIFTHVNLSLFGVCQGPRTARTVAGAALLALLTGFCFGFGCSEQFGVPMPDKLPHNIRGT